MTTNNDDLIVKFFDQLEDARSTLGIIVGHALECESLAVNFMREGRALLSNFLAQSGCTMIKLNHLASQDAEGNEVLRST